MSATQKISLTGNSALSVAHQHCLSYCRGEWIWLRKSILHAHMCMQTRSSVHGCTHSLFLMRVEAKIRTERAILLCLAASVHALPLVVLDKNWHFYFKGLMWSSYDGELLGCAVLSKAAELILGPSDQTGRNWRKGSCVMDVNGRPRLPRDLYKPGSLTLLSFNHRSCFFKAQGHHLINALYWVRVCSWVIESAGVHPFAHDTSNTVLRQAEKNKLLTRNWNTTVQCHLNLAIKTD